MPTQVNIKGSHCPCASSDSASQHIFQWHVSVLPCYSNNVTLCKNKRLFSKITPNNQDIYSLFLFFLVIYIGFKNVARFIINQFSLACHYLLKLLQGCTFNLSLFKVTSFLVSVAPSRLWSCKNGHVNLPIYLCRNVFIWG